MYEPLKARIAETAIPANVKTGLLALLEQCGPVALSIGVQVLEAAHPEWTPLLEALKSSILALLSGLGSGS